MDAMTAQRTLIVMRHAKAGELPGGPDVERALRPRGCRDATAAGRWLAGQGAEPDAVLCSPARRTRQTWQYVGAELGSRPRTVIDPRLYQTGAADVLVVIAEHGGQARELLYVGHNPAAADVVETLCGGPVRFPTAAIAIIGLDIAWAGLAAGSGELSGELTAYWEPGPGP